MVLWSSISFAELARQLDRLHVRAEGAAERRPRRATRSVLDAAKDAIVEGFCLWAA